MKYAAKTDIGKLRDKNEDSYFASCELNLFILADGMGGHLAGELASSMITSLIAENFKTERDLEKIIKDANRAIYEKSKEDNRYSGMGTTLSLAHIDGDIFNYVNIGDSRIYRINEDIELITKDDSFVNYLIEVGEITADQAKDHPKKNVLTKAIGTAENIEFETFYKKIEQGDKFLICSDGLTNMVDEKEILDIVKNYEPSEACDKLVESALNSGGVDNITLILIYK